MKSYNHDIDSPIVNEVFPPLFSPLLLFIYFFHEHLNMQVWGGGFSSTVNPTHRALQYLGDSLSLFHHVEVLPEVRRHISFTDVVRVIFIDAVKISLFVRHAGGRRGCDYSLADLSTHALIFT